MIYDYVSLGTNFETGTDDDGIEWCVSSLVGWHDTPPLSQDVMAITSANRELIVRSQLSARPVVVRGTGKGALGTDKSEVVLAFDNLAGLFWPLRGDKLLTVTEAGITRELGTKPAGSIRKMWAGELAFIFEVPLLAEDPLKYEDEQDMGYNGSIAVINAGNFETWPVIMMDTDGIPEFTNTTVGSSGNVVGFTDTLPAGTIIDFKHRTIIGPGAVDHYPKLDVARDDWWPLTVGVNNLTRGGTGDATIAWRNAWL